MLNIFSGSFLSYFSSLDDHREQCKVLYPPQDAVVTGEACDLDYWFTDSILYPNPSKTPVKPKPPMSLDALPQECRQVLLAK
jgi:penicillin-insensitive murein DD-endopeptidase